MVLFVFTNPSSDRKSPLNEQQHSWLSCTIQSTTMEKTVPTDISSEKDLLNHGPTRAEKLEMKLALKTPSQWLTLLCKEWAAENVELLSLIDSNFLQYKSYLKGLMSSQLLCRVSIYSEGFSSSEKNDLKNKINFWKFLGVKDEFDCDYICSQIEKFCSLYGLRNHASEDEQNQNPFTMVSTTTTTSSAPSEALTTPTHGGLSAVDGSGVVPPSMAIGNTHTPIVPYMMDNAYASPSIHVAGMHPSITYPSIGSYTDSTTAAAVSLAVASSTTPKQSYLKKGKGLPITSTRKVTNKEIVQGRQEAKTRTRDAIREEAQFKRVAEKAAREASREERRRRKVEIREIREQRVLKDKEAALQRAAELVQSNRVPIEITRGAAAATAAANAAVNATSVVPVEININAPEKRTRSSIIVSTARDLQQIVTHSRNLWAKYNAIAKQHNQKVNWITVAKELGIHVKVREKYARMYSRAEQRGFDFANCGHYKIKDYPHIFLDPTLSEDRNTKNNRVMNEGQYVKVDDKAIAAANAAVARNNSVQHQQQQLQLQQSSNPSITPIIQRHILDALPYGNIVKGSVIPGTIDQYNTLQNNNAQKDITQQHHNQSSPLPFNSDNIPTNTSEQLQQKQETSVTPVIPLLTEVSTTTNDDVSTNGHDHVHLIVPKQPHVQDQDMVVLQQDQVLHVLTNPKVDELQIMQPQPPTLPPAQYEAAYNAPTVIPIIAEYPPKTTTTEDNATMQMVELSQQSNEHQQQLPDVSSTDSSSKTVEENEVKLLIETSASTVQATESSSQEPIIDVRIKEMEEVVVTVNKKLVLTGL